MQSNIARMQAQMDRLGVRFRPHVKTAKSLPVAQRQLEAGANGITVSTLKEAEQFFAAGVTDILYAVGIAPNKFQAALELRRRGCDLKLLTDSLDAARALVAFGREHRHRFDLLLEIDSDGHRAGIRPDDPLLLEVADALGVERRGRRSPTCGRDDPCGRELRARRSAGAGADGGAGAQPLRRGRPPPAAGGPCLRNRQRRLDAHGAVGSQPRWRHRGPRRRLRVLRPGDGQRRRLHASTTSPCRS